MDISFLERPRGVTAEYHLQQVTNWLNYDNGRKLDNVLVYVSLELRCAIERDIFETLYIVKGTLTDKEQKSCRKPSGMFTLMKKYDPLYRKTFEFSKIYLDVISYPSRITLTDTKLLTKKWHELSQYCHQILKPVDSFESKDRQFQMSGFQVVQDVIDYYYSIQHTQKGYIKPSSMPHQIKQVYDDFVQGKIDNQQTKIRLNMILPVLKQNLIIK